MSQWENHAVSSSLSNPRRGSSAQFIVDLPLSTKFATDGKRNRMPAFESVSAAVLRSRGESGEESERKGIADFYMTMYEKGPLQPLADALVQGQFKLLVVDDDKMGRKVLRRRFSRLFPDAHIDKVASGQEAITSHDTITIDHFMAVNEMSGEETIQALQAKDVDALIAGISGN